MLVTKQALDDAAASTRVALYLALVGFVLGVLLTAIASYQLLPESARRLIPPEAVLKLQIARLPVVGPLVLPEIAAKRPGIAKESPTLSASFDAWPFNSLLGGLFGALALPFGVAYIKTIRLDRLADAGRRNAIQRR
ncbi:hypothetical protein [Dechloromonas hortensis]|uniref:hypothetical protein n=1 Tax=Dechloromonas hortensis TaxID=337779 RepID=UPI0012922603|nr:hypothetical protein [Dechloromonas hortensis]